MDLFLKSKKQLKVLFLSTYPPRACGIATFTQDLVGALHTAGRVSSSIAAVSDSDYDYPPEVSLILEQQNPDAYTETAEKINSSGADLLMIEHEFGIYGGKYGEYLLKLTKKLKIPYLITLHTVLPKPTKKQFEIIHTLAEGCRKLVTMSGSSVKILEEIYGANPEKIAVIHHGVPEFPMEDRDVLKKRNGLEGRFIVSTFGLISPGKGLLYGIEAIARAAKKHPEVLYLILGQTHPVIRSRDGEKYRESLEQAVTDLGIENNVRFVNRYLTKEEIIRYLCLSDVYMTPYLGKEQAVSGTLAYAVGYGCVIVSTPYPYAQEMLAEGRGLLAKFRNAPSLAKCILEVLEHPEKQTEMEQKTLALGKEMTWSRVAEKYFSVFCDALSTKGRSCE